jgi:4-amino-4-deoxy-L-arabinose transferase-like glycosyltransferase
MFAGSYGMEQHYYEFMPVHPLLLAAVFRCAGPGVFQARFDTVIMGLMVLILTYTLALRLFPDAPVGLLAVLFLLMVRLNGTTFVRLTGILLLDVARVARYDIVVPVFGLTALHAYLSAREKADNRWYFLAGLLAGLSGLAHLYGAFWLPVLVLLAMWHKRSWTSIGAMLLGFTLPWLLYVAYVLGGLNDWRGQMRANSVRFELLNPAWYMHNVLREFERYGPGLGRLRPAILLRVGFWSALVALPLSLGTLAWRALRQADWAAQTLVTPIVIFPLLFAFLITVKIANYSIAFLPLTAIAAAWGVRTLWVKMSHTGRARWVRPALAVLLTAVIAEGATRVAVLESAAATTSPYYDFIAKVRHHLPPGTRVLGLHNYWFGLEDYDYRSFWVPLSWADPGYEPQPVPFDAALDRLAPDIVIVDPKIRGYFDSIESRGDPTPALFRDWLQRHNAQLIVRLDDNTYGLMEIYGVDKN